ncbi:hypothetical protein [Thioclava sp. GXIMD2076]|uniref:hypothetical protein n=1 Tax=Thioclava sp. GXIMD2076 TaxID=3131931 RepID=UPI0030D47BBB
MTYEDFGRVHLSTNRYILFLVDLVGSIIGEVFICLPPRSAENAGNFERLPILSSG